LSKEIEFKDANRVGSRRPDEEGVPCRAGLNRERDAGLAWASGEIDEGNIIAELGGIKVVHDDWGYAAPLGGVA
jgi:hypothetical protein